MDNKYNIQRDYKCILAEARKGPQLTLEQINAVVSNYPGGSNTAARLVYNLQREGWIAPVAQEAPAKPSYLPIKRKVRWADLEDGCVLRYCGNDFFKHHQDRGMLIVGDLYKIRKDARGRITIPYTTPNTSGTGVDAGEWAGNPYNDPWEFVSNPNYVHGFRIGETVYSTGGPAGIWGASTKYGPYIVDGKSKGPLHSCAGLPFEVSMTNGCEFPASLLTRDQTKAYGYKAPVEYKVKDGVAKEGDVIWWLASYGDPEKVIVGGYGWDMNKANVKGYPDAYQLREPQKVWDYKNK